MFTLQERTSIKTSLSQFSISYMVVSEEIFQRKFLDDKFGPRVQALQWFMSIDRWMVQERYQFAVKGRRARLMAVHYWPGFARYDTWFRTRATALPRSPERSMRDWRRWLLLVSPRAWLSVVIRAWTEQREVGTRDGAERRLVVPPTSFQWWPMIVWPAASTTIGRVRHTYVRIPAVSRISVNA